MCNLRDTYLQNSRYRLTHSILRRVLGIIAGVTPLTDVTGFGLLGHLIEVADGSGVSARIYNDKIPVIPSVHEYLNLKCVPSGTNRNFASYGEKVSSMEKRQKNILCDPQTGGGLPVAVEPDSVSFVENVLKSHGIMSVVIGEIIPR